MDGPRTVLAEMFGPSVEGPEADAVQIGAVLFARLQVQMLPNLQKKTTLS